MAKITFIGAGSFGFTRKLVKDVLTFPSMEDAVISLMDIDENRLEFARRACERIVTEGGYPAKVTATTDRRRALEGADAVVITILVGGVDVWRHDLEIPKEYGISYCIGDTRGPAGIFRALRTIPVILDIVKDVEELCPKAIVLNYTNPMSMNCRAVQRTSKVLFTGLCHSVQGTSKMLARWINAPYEEIDYVCAGINHTAWFIKFNWKGEDAYPLIRQAIQNPEIYNQERVRNEMFLHLDYYVTESSWHNSEYNWWFRKRPDLIEKYCDEEHRSIKKHTERAKNWDDEVEKWFSKPVDLSRGVEYAAYIINAYLGHEPYEFNGNVPNKGLITNLPQDACVEVPLIVNRRGLNAIHVGALPPQLAALNNIQIASEEMAVEAALTGNPRLVFQACIYDPLTASLLSLAEIKEMVQRMLDHNADGLPTFKSVKI
jgi:alpha-galactosidase